MNAGESLSTPAQLVALPCPSLFPPPTLVFSFFKPARLDTQIGRTPERFSQATRVRTDKWDGTDDTAHIVLRHIPLTQDHTLVIPGPGRVLRSPTVPASMRLLPRPFTAKRRSAASTFRADPFLTHCRVVPTTSVWHGILISRDWQAKIMCAAISRFTQSWHPAAPKSPLIPAIEDVGARVQLHLYQLE